jgi:DNA repair protein RecN (Recombination protein N)
MLQELTIRNFALLEEVRLSFRAGLNILTGETGAGKSIIIDAIGTVLGGRASSEVIRTGAERAMVEAIFELPLPDTDYEVLGALLDELGLAADEEQGARALILARELSRSGRNVARVNGRAVPVSVLAQIAGLLIDIHGQHEHLSLLRPGAQRDLLDRYGGLMPQRAIVAGAVRELRDVRAQLRAMQQDEREVARRIDLLSFQVEEIQAAQLTPGEEESLLQERTRLANASRLAELASAIHQALAGGAGDQPSALDLLGEAAKDLAQLCRIDQEMETHEAILGEATAQVDDLARTVRRYQDDIEFAPERLDQVNERLELIHQLERKYGVDVPDVLAFGERAAAELEGLVNREARTAELEKRAASLERRIAGEAMVLSAARGAAGRQLSEQVGRELRALNLRGEFSVGLHHEPSADGLAVEGEDNRNLVRFDETGIDAIEFRFAPNPGEPAKSVARTASGGELSRILLALKAVLSAADRTPTLIFDEIDAGIGGRNGQVIGEKLAQIGERHQVLCVTHLPQIAAYGDAHYFIAKQVSGGRTVTTVVALDETGRLEEIAQMLGGATPATRQQAGEMAIQASEWKRQRVASTSGVEPAAGPESKSRTKTRSKRPVVEQPQLLQGVK